MWRRPEAVARPSLGLVLGAVATAAVVAAVAAGLSLIDGPQARRDARLDDKRIADLDHLAGAIDCYWTLEEGRSLPEDLDALAARLGTPAGARPSCPASAACATAATP